MAFDFCKILDTPRYVNKDILVFRNGEFYSLKTNKFLRKQQKHGKTYSTIYQPNKEGSPTTMIVPYIICYLFRNDYLKHGKNEKNYFEYIDGNPGNCSADNIRANYYEYEIVKYITDDTVIVNISGYEVILNINFVNNELHKYKFRPILNGCLVYFISETNKRQRRLHQLVFEYYHPEEIITGAIDHYNHNTLDNRIGNLKHINHIINSMNNMNIKPNWDETKQGYNVRYKIDGVAHGKRFSVYKYGSKEAAYEEALKYIEEVALPNKKKAIEEIDMKLKINELNNLIKYFVNCNMNNVIYEALINNGIQITSGDCGFTPIVNIENLK